MLTTSELISTEVFRIYDNVSQDLQSDSYRTRHQQRIFLFVRRLHLLVEVYMVYVATSLLKQPYGNYTNQRSDLEMNCSSDKKYALPLNQFPYLRSHDTYFFTNFGKNADRLF